MTEQEFFALLQTLSIPVAYRSFHPEDGNKVVVPPFAVYYRTDNENTYADNIVYHANKNMVVELYTPRVRNLTIEQEIETLLTNNEIAFETEEIYLAEEKMVEIVYSFMI